MRRLPQVGAFDFKRLLWLGLCVPFVFWSGPDLVRPANDPPAAPPGEPPEPHPPTVDAASPPAFDADDASAPASSARVDPNHDLEVGALPTGGAAAMSTLPPRGAPSHRQELRPVAPALADAATAALDPPAERRAPAPLAGHAAAAARWPANPAGVALRCGGHDPETRKCAHAHAVPAIAARTPDALPSASMDREVFVTAVRMVTR